MIEGGRPQGGRAAALTPQAASGASRPVPPGIHPGRGTALTILALDVGNHCGWAVGTDGDVRSGVEDFTPKSGDAPGARWSLFGEWLEDMITDNSVQILACERWTGGPGIAGKVLAGFITRVEEAAAVHGLALLTVSPAELKRWMTGNGHASKEEMIAAVKASWWEDGKLTSDEADALALFHCALEKAG